MYLIRFLLNFAVILQIYLNFMAFQLREMSQAISCVISIIQTGDEKFASGDYISPVGRQKAT